MRITGKNGKILSESSRTTVTTAQVLTDSGDHKTYNFPAGHQFLDPTQPPTITVNDANPTVAFTVDFIMGSVTFASALQVADVVKANNYTYSTLVEIGSMYNWAVDTKIDIVDVTAFQDVWHQKLSTFKGWTGSAEGYYVSAFWFNLFTPAKNVYVALYPEASSTERWVGAAFVDWGIKVAKDAAVTQTIRFEGNHELRRLTA